MFSFQKKDINCGTARVSDALKNALHIWTPYTPVFIHAQTGRGKNTFINKHILKHAEKKGEFVLLISNRYVLRMQQRVQVWESVGSYPMPQYIIGQSQQLGNVITCTYQELFYNFDYIWQKYGNIGYVIFDEAHFFLADSTFNATTTCTLHSIISRSLNAVRIYLSATPEEIIPIVYSVEAFYALQRYNAVGENIFRDFVDNQLVNFFTIALNTTIVVITSLSFVVKKT